MDSRHCTCKDHNCALHPLNHALGCTPCVRKNLRAHEIPSCFFAECLDEKPDGYTFSHFADHVRKAESM